MCLTQQESNLMVIPPQPQDSSSSSTFGSMSSALYTPQKKKQKVRGSRPPLAPSKNKNSAASGLFPRQLEDESRCEQDVRATTGRRLFPIQEESNSKRQRVDYTTLAPWCSPYVHKKKTKTAEDSSFRNHSLDDNNNDEDERMTLLDGLELLETMSFDEFDCRQGDDEDQSLCYSVISEG